MDAVGTFLASPVGSWLRVFLAAALGLYLVDLQDPEMALSVTDYGIAGLVSVLPVIIAALNAQDPRFGSHA